MADGVVVGSAIVRQIERNPDADALEFFVRPMAARMRR
jgi:tryptophan synthase alpha subunit